MKQVKRERDHAVLSGADRTSSANKLFIILHICTSKYFDIRNMLQVNFLKEIRTTIQ